MTIEEIINFHFSTNPLHDAFLKRAQEGKLTRDENPVTHFCVYVGIFDPTTHRVFMGHHKKANSWIFNGGHIDKGEAPLVAAQREVREEVNVTVATRDIIGPSLINTIDIKFNINFACRKHWHFWYFVPIEQHKIDVTFPGLTKEFYENKWLTIPEAKKITTDLSNLEALDWLKKVNPLG